MVKQAEAVAHRATRSPYHHVEGGLFNGNPFTLGKIGEMGGQFAARHPLQLVALAAGEDGHRHLVQLSGGEHEINMFRRLLQGLEQGVEGLSGQHVDFIDDNDLEA